MLVKSVMVNLTDKEPIPLPMGLFMKVNGEMENAMDKEPIPLPEGVFMSVNGRITNSTDKGHTLMLMEVFMLVNLGMGKGLWIKEPILQPVRKFLKQI